MRYGGQRWRTSRRRRERLILAVGAVFVLRRKEPGTARPYRVPGYPWLPWIFVIAALLLPYVAVVMANAADTKSDGFELMDGPSQDRQLPGGTNSE